MSSHLLSALSMAEEGMSSILTHSLPRKLCPHLWVFSFFRSPGFITPTWSLIPGEAVTLSLRNPSLKSVKFSARGTIHMYFFSLFFIKQFLEGSGECWKHFLYPLCLNICWTCLLSKVKSNEGVWLAELCCARVGTLSYGLWWTVCQAFSCFWSQ